MNKEKKGQEVAVIETRTVQLSGSAGTIKTGT